MESTAIDDQDLGSTRAEFVKNLTKIGPRLTTTVIVNGRSLLLDATIKLVEQLPDDACLARRGREITINPDPFTAGLATVYDPAPAQMVARLIERQDDTDRQAARERAWWRRLGRRLVGGS